MALYQYEPFSIPVWGDGSSTTMSVDLAGQINQLNVTPQYPKTILQIFPLGSITVTGTLEGTVLNLSFSSAPAVNSQGTVSVILGF